MKLIFLFITFFGSVLSSCPLPHYSVFDQIVKNKPTINREYAKKLSVIIETESRNFDINSRLFAAILMQESSYVMSARNCVTQKRGYEVCTDFGLSQIHFKTVKLYNFDKKRLTTDVHYSIKAGLKVLSDFKKRYGNKEEYFWTRYNTSKPSLRKKYKERVERWL